MNSLDSLVIACDIQKNFQELIELKNQIQLLIKNKNTIFDEWFKNRLKFHFNSSLQTMSINQIVKIQLSVLYAIHDYSIERTYCDLQTMVNRYITHMNTCKTNIEIYMKNTQESFFFIVTCKDIIDILNNYLNSSKNHFDKYLYECKAKISTFKITDKVKEA